MQMIIWKVLLAFDETQICYDRTTLRNFLSYIRGTAFNHMLKVSALQLHLCVSQICLNGHVTMSKTTLLFCLLLC